MEIFYVLLVILLVTRACGEIAVRFGQPALVGELIGGVLLGIAVHQFHNTFPVLSEIQDNEVFHAITDLGVFFLMLLAGMEMSPKDLAKASGGAFVVACGGLVVPFATGWAMGWWFLPESDFKLAQTMFIATALAITAIPVAVKVLMDIGQLESKAGKIIVSAAVFDDVLGLILLAILTALISSGEWPGVAGLGLIVLKVALFFGFCSFIGLWLVPRLSKWLKRLWVDEFEFSFLLILGLIFSVIAELFGLHFILGAFLAGLFFTKRTLGSKVHKEVESKTNAITTGFLAPIFFASIGMHLNTQAFVEIPVFVAVLVVAAMLTKIIGAGLTAKWTGLSSKEAMGVGMGMSGRGAVELIIADIALRAGLFKHPEPIPAIVGNLFSATVIMAILTTLLMPIGLKIFLSPEENSKQKNSDIPSN